MKKSDAQDLGPTATTDSAPLGKTDSTDFLRRAKAAWLRLQRPLMVLSCPFVVVKLRKTANSVLSSGPHRNIPQAKSDLYRD